MTATLEAESANEPTAAAPRQFAAFIAAVPIVLVNTLAVIGQCQWASTHLHWGHPGQALFAGALETTSLAVMYLAHTALIEGDSAWRQKVFAYAIAGGSASVNWQEHSNAWHPTPPAFVFAGASLLSPILWAAYSRFAARTVMREAGLIDRRAAKFSFARWLMFPRRTFKALRYSVWHSVQSPAKAIAASQILGDNANDRTGNANTRSAKRPHKKADNTAERQDGNGRANANGANDNDSLGGNEADNANPAATGGNANPPADPNANDNTGNANANANGSSKGRTDEEWIAIATSVYVNERDRLGKRPPEKTFWNALLDEVDRLTAEGTIPTRDAPSLGTAKRVRDLVEKRFPELAPRIHPVAS